MNRFFSICAILMCLNFPVIGAERIVIDDRLPDLSVGVDFAGPTRTVLTIEIGGIRQTTVEIDGRLYHQLELEGEGNLAEPGQPAVPFITRSLLIGDKSRIRANIIEMEYQDFADFMVAPSKGNLPRTVDPETVPYAFDVVYLSDNWFPGEIIELGEPYIMRDFRGLPVHIRIAQYNPVKATLRVYKRLVIEFVDSGIDTRNTIERSQLPATIDPDWNEIYRRRFVNYSPDVLLYTPVLEAGEMLIICYDQFSSYMSPFVEWKNQKGMKTRLVNVSTVGNTGAQIKNFIQAWYDSTDLAYVLLVGDAAQVATYLLSGDASDPSYAKVAGADYYPDIFVGRFSAENAAHVQTQVQRVIDYEKNPSGTNWFRMAAGIASDEGPGHFGEYDYQHMNNIRTDLLANGYTTIDQIYDPGATAAQVSTALNAGRGFVNYCGHGSTTSWSTTGFSNTNVNALTNVGKLPFIFSVACVNGDFDGTTCFGEAWLRASSGGNPSGAMAAYMSSINQTWNPPMDAQDEAVDLLMAKTKTTFGGICYNGSCRMIDINGSGGADMFNTWHIFGDPSLLLRTDNPTTMAVAHSDDLLFTATQFSVTVSGVAGAQCALYHNGILFGSAFTDALGQAIIPISGTLPLGQGVLLTVTAFNKIPYIDTILVIAPTGPYIVFDSCIVNDLPGNGNGSIDYGESVFLGIRFRNVGPDTARNVVALLSSSDPYVLITDNSANYGSIAGNSGIGYVADGFSISIAADIPDNHAIPFHLDISGSALDNWVCDFLMVAHAPNLIFASATINSGGNNVLDPGENGIISVTVNNYGGAAAEAVTAQLFENDPYIDVIDASGYFGDIPASGGGNNDGDPFSLSISPTCPRGRQGQFSVVLAGTRGFVDTLAFSLVIGDKETIYADDFSVDRGWTGLGGTSEWTIGPATGGTGSDSYGGPDPANDHSPGTDNNVLGNDLTSGSGGDYNASIGQTYWATSPIIDCSRHTDVELDFYRWLGIERNTYDHAYIQVYNGASWVEIFSNPATTIDDQAWNLVHYDVSAYADSNAVFRIRFGLGTTDYAWQYCGWNIDDIVVKGYFQGIISAPALVITPGNILDSLVQGEQVQHQMTIRNLGNAALQIAFTPTQSWLSCSGGQLNIDPLDSSQIQITINTATLNPGSHPAAINYVSNDPQHPSGSIPVNVVIRAPAASVYPGSVWDTLAVEQSSDIPLKIWNSGDGLLIFTLSADTMFLRRPDTPESFSKNAIGEKIDLTPEGFRLEEGWLTISPASGTVQPHDSISATIHLSAANRPVGEYSGRIVMTTNDPIDPIIVIPVELVVSGSECSYFLGDINGDGSVLGSDVTYGVRYFKSLGLPPPDSCYLDSTRAYIYIAGDVNGNCEFRGSDITRLVGYFKGGISLSYCHFLPPMILPPGRIGPKAEAIPALIE